MILIIYDLLLEASSLSSFSRVVFVAFLHSGIGKKKGGEKRVIAKIL